jgi:hypothetical protein
MVGGLVVLIAAFEPGNKVVSRARWESVCIMKSKTVRCTSIDNTNAAKYSNYDRFH